MFKKRTTTWADCPLDCPLDCLLALTAAGHARRGPVDAPLPPAPSRSLLPRRASESSRSPSACPSEAVRIKDQKRLGSRLRFLPGTKRHKFVAFGQLQCYRLARFRTRICGSRSQHTAPLSSCMQYLPEQASGVCSAHTPWVCTSRLQVGCRMGCRRPTPVCHGASRQSVHFPSASCV